MIGVLIVDDHAMVRVGLERLLSTFEDIEVVGAVQSGEEAIDFVDETRPDVVLMDMSLNGIDGAEATRRIVSVHPGVSVIAISTFDAPDQVARALNAGASGYLLKDVESEVLVAGIRSVLRGGAPLSPSIAANLIRSDWKIDSTPSHQLTKRELQVLQLIVRGEANKQIARSLGISEKTVKSHCSRLFQRIHVRDRTQAAIWAERNLRDHN